MQLWYLSGQAPLKFTSPLPSPLPINSVLKATAIINSSLRNEFLVVHMVSIETGLPDERTV